MSEHAIFNAAFGEKHLTKSRANNFVPYAFGEAYKSINKFAALRNLIPGYVGNGRCVLQLRDSSPQLLNNGRSAIARLRFHRNRCVLNKRLLYRRALRRNRALLNNLLNRLALRCNSLRLFLYRGALGRYKGFGLGLSIYPRRLKESVKVALCAALGYAVYGVVGKNLPSAHYATDGCAHCALFGGSDWIEHGVLVGQRNNGISRLVSDVLRQAVNDALNNFLLAFIYQPVQPHFELRRALL